MNLEMFLLGLSAFFVLVFAVGRIVRLVTFDDFPPTTWIRDRWDRLTAGSAWNKLLHCGYCFGFYVALVLVGVTAGLLFGWGLFATVLGWWCVVCVSLAVGYLSAIIVATNWG